MRGERKARISGLAGTEHARNRTLPDLTFPVTEWDLGTRLVQYCDIIIMRFMILCDRLHKVSPNPNPQQNSNGFAMHEKRDTL